MSIRRDTKTQNPEVMIFPNINPVYWVSFIKKPPPHGLANILSLFLKRKLTQIQYQSKEIFEIPLERITVLVKCLAELLQEQ